MAQINWHKIILHDNSINLFNFFLQLWCIFHQTGDKKKEINLLIEDVIIVLMIILCFTIKLKRLNVITLIMGYWDVLVNPKDRKCLASLCTVIYIAWLAYLSKAITVRSFPLFTAFWVPPLKAIWKLVVFLQTMCYSLLGRCQQVFNLCWTSCSKCLLFIIEQIVYTMELVYEYISNIIDNVIPILHHSVFWF